MKLLSAKRARDKQYLNQIWKTTRRDNVYVFRDPKNLKKRIISNQSFKHTLVLLTTDSLILSVGSPRGYLAFNFSPHRR